MIAQAQNALCWRVDDLEVVVADEDIDATLSPETRRSIEDIWARAMASGRVTYESDVVLAIRSERDEGRTTIYCALGRYRHVLAATELGMPWSSLAVTGLVTTSQTPEALILCGRRSSNVSTSPGAYELVPSGTIDRSDVSKSQTAQVEQRFLIEFEEETGLPASAIRKSRPIGIVSCAGVQDIVVGAVLDVSSVNGSTLPPTPEYSDLRLLDCGRVRHLMNEHQVVPTMRPILEELAPHWLGSNVVVSRPQ